MDPAVLAAMKDMTRRYGYHLDAAMHPQSLSTATFRAGGIDGAKDEATAANKRKGAKGGNRASKGLPGGGAKMGTSRSVIRAAGGGGGKPRH